MPSVLMTGDINLMNVTDPHAPFRRIGVALQSADLLVSNLECSLFIPPHGHALEHEGFFADPDIGARALKEIGVDIVGIANNVNYGEAAILGSMATLDRYRIPFAGAGMNREAARRPVIIEKNGVRYGFLQRSSVYWSTNHEAGETGVGIAVIRGHTAYHVPMYREGSRTPPFNRPGIPPLIVTWADSEYLDWFAEDVAALKAEADVVIASCHWGLSTEIFAYMKQIAKAAIDAGADVVMGHGPHQPLAIGHYKGKPIFYGLGSFSFHTGHLGIKHGNWIGLLARLDRETSGTRTSFTFVRHNDDNETIPASLADESKAFETLKTASASEGTLLTQVNDAVVVTAADA
jgi:poly-gamma-glutamate capsule biosynthesis protein CapA/YwtB (metallophosphatase superfamily)